MQEVIEVCLPTQVMQVVRVPLLRLGRTGDGGYLIDQRSISETRIIVGLGINRDWSFEKDLSSACGAYVVGVDGSVSFKILCSDALRILPGIILFPKKALRKLLLPFAFASFFSGVNRHLPMMVSQENRKGISIHRIFADLDSSDHRRNVFLKIDIEGEEYRILDDVVEVAPRLTGLVVEFHDFDLHFQRILDFIDALPMNLVYFNINNYGSVGVGRFPTVVEITFSPYSGPIGSVEKLGICDQLNDPGGPKYTPIGIDLL